MSNPYEIDDALDRPAFCSCGFHSNLLAVEDHIEYMIGTGLFTHWDHHVTHGGDTVR